MALSKPLINFKAGLLPGLQCLLARLPSESRIWMGDSKLFEILDLNLHEGPIWQLKERCSSELEEVQNGEMPCMVRYWKESGKQVEKLRSRKHSAFGNHSYARHRGKYQ